MNRLLLSGLQLLLAPYLLLQKRKRWKRRGARLEWDRARWKPNFAPIERADKNHLVLVAMGFSEARLAREIARGLRERGTDGEISIAVYDLESVERSGGLSGERLLPIPFDFAPCVRRWIERTNPTHVIFVERFLWTIWGPMLCEKGVKTGAVGAYIRPKSRLKQFWQNLQYRPCWRALDLICLRSPEHREFVASQIAQCKGEMPRVVETGSLKFLPRLPELEDEREQQLNRWISQVGSRPLLAAGSTQSGDEAWILDAFLPLRNQLGAALLLAPRNAPRFEIAESLCLERGLSVARRSAFDDSNCEVRQAPDVLLLDTMGELSVAYARCMAVFIGGTLRGGGGHNVLEPVAHGKPVFFGPVRGDFAREQADCQAAEVGFRVGSSAELREAWAELIQSPAKRADIADRAREFNLRGALNWQLSLDEIERFLENENPVSSDISSRVR